MSPSRDRLLKYTIDITYMDTMCNLKIRLMDFVSVRYMYTHVSIKPLELLVKPQETTQFYVTQSSLLFKTKRMRILYCHSRTLVIEAWVFIADYFL